MQEDCLVFGITVVALAVNSCVPKILRGRGGGGGHGEGSGDQCGWLSTRGDLYDQPIA